MVQRLIKEHIEPDIKYQITNIPVYDTKPTRYLLKIEVFKSAYVPVTLKFKGTASIYVRHFGKTSLATSEEIRDMILNSENVFFDSYPTDEVFKKEEFTDLFTLFKKVNNRELTTKELISIGFMSAVGKLTQGAQLFKDDYHGDKTLVVCGQFLGVTKGDDVFYSIKYLSSNLLREYEEIRDYVTSRTACGFIKGDIENTELISYPRKALDEAIINALVHRNYFISGSKIEVNLFKDRLEIVSPGSLPGSKYLQKERDLAAIPPIRRNEVICNVFTMLKMMEKRGSGFDKIEEEYASYGDKFASYVISSANYFALTLPDLAFRNGLVSETVNPIIYTSDPLKEKRDN